MNPVVTEINELLAGPPMVEDNIDIPEEFDDEAYQYGVKRRSGRYPWGSGENPYQRTKDFLARYDDYKSKGFSDKEIADAMGCSTGDLRIYKSHAKNERRKLNYDRAKSLREDGYSNTEIARIMGLPGESSVRQLFDENVQSRADQAEEIAKVLKAEVTEKGYLDVGKGAAAQLGVSETKLKEALLILEMDGYETRGIQIPQTTNPRNKTTVAVLTPPETPYKDIYDHVGDIKQITDYHSEDGGFSFDKKHYPSSIDSNRIAVCYADEGGKEKDGLIEIRPGCEDLSLGNSHFAQVRILVDDSHYLKGMAVYNPDLPEGVDIRFNTSKTSDTPMMAPNKNDPQVLKPIKKDDPNNPFGAQIKANGQSWYEGRDGERHLSLINKINEEGDWEKQHKRLSSQFLSKQPISLIKKQLDLTYDDYADKYSEIMDYTNPTIKRKLLMDLADTCDGAAIHLKAASLPRQRNQVLIPIPEMADNEVYAPNFRDGEHVVLVRHPYAGPFESPELIVNNKVKAAIDVLPKGTGTTMDAIGINSKVAEKLSGADFDGDSVAVIPVNDRVHVSTKPSLKGLKDFDPHAEYTIPPGDTTTKRMTKKLTQRKMGEVSNLITDMTLKGANEDEIARAVRHSMVVIDAEKHGLDYQRSYKDNGIAELKQKYQNGGGASTLISKAKQDYESLETVGSGHIDPETGKWVYKERERHYIDKNGKDRIATKKTSLILAKDAHELSSGTKQEEAYADYAERMKALANLCRKKTFEVGKLQKNAEASKFYKEEVDSLKKKLADAEKNAPIERQANIVANEKIKMMKQQNPNMESKEEKKLRQMAIEEARVNLGARSRQKTAIKISDKEWSAIQSGAISDTMLSNILKYCDMTEVKQRAMPRSTTTLSTAKINKINSMKRSGYTNQEIADAIDVSLTTIYKYEREKEESNE